MSIPTLRQPKTTKTLYENVDKFVILTLKDGAKLVVSSDAFNGILTVVDGFKCVLCSADIPLDKIRKENHKVSMSHQRLLERYPHQEEFGANLIRGLSKDKCYCTICRAIMPAHMLMHHIASDSHLEELEKASIRARTYQPTDANNNM